MTVRVVATQMANCSTALMPRQQMFCRRKYSECDRRPVFECQLSAVVWLGRRWRAGSQEPGNSGCAQTVTGEQVWRSEVNTLPHRKPVQLAEHWCDVVTSSRASNQWTNSRLKIWKIESPSYSRSSCFSLSIVALQTTVYTILDLSLLMQLVCTLHTLYFLLASYAAMAFVCLSEFWRILQGFADYGGNNC